MALGGLRARASLMCRVTSSISIDSEPIMTTSQSELLNRDQAHMIHPLHNAGVHANGHVWVHADGVMLTGRCVGFAIVFQII